MKEQSNDRMPRLAIKVAIAIMIASVISGLLGIGQALGGIHLYSEAQLALRNSEKSIAVLTEQQIETYSSVVWVVGRSRLLALIQIGLSMCTGGLAFLIWILIEEKRPANLHNKAMQVIAAERGKT